MTTGELAPTTRWSSIVVVWVAALVCAVLIGVYAPTYTPWLAIAMAGCTLVALCIQLATRQKHGFIDRLAASVCGAFVVLAVAGGVFALVHAG
ncbi:MAG TPA: hypothetical protein VN133_04765 [Humibacter sp.]|nr:hypothetical protein [Humibacter sp.]